ncbi:MAG: 50S ribosomal protein L24 [Aeoliella sp.]
MLIKEGDSVVVISGEYRSDNTHQVISVDRAKGKALVEGVNRVWKHVRRSQKYPQGGRLSMEMPVDVSNLKFHCPSCNAGVRLGVRYLDDGSKERYCKKCGSSVGKIAPAKPAYTK